ncbi:MAG TPA: electron transport complex subunit RsxD [Gammaproteobacteria bacterium]|nr:electron transport complex subunit RsxD [Gammaproteobacteria bacterium]
MTAPAPTSPHIHAPVSVTRVMFLVLLALIPGLVAYIWFFGWGIVFNILTATAVAVISEAAMLRARGRPVGLHLGDLSALVTAVLLAFAIPPLAPWWITAIGSAFAIVVAKHLYGGLGYNPFNPAMVGYVMLLISFPREMTSWLPPLDFSTYRLDFMEAGRFIFTGHLPPDVAFDALTEATPLDTLRTNLMLGNTVPEIRAQLGLDEETSRLLSVTPIFGALGGKGWEWVNGGFLLGGLWLIKRRIVDWRIPVGMLGTLAVMALLFHVIDPDRYASPLFHLFSGATMLGAFFIATDPVTAATSPPGRLIYGMGIGILLYVIRSWGGYPDAVAFAVLLMNMVAPVIDHRFKPRVFGHGGK